jgi:hypothetical protein
VVSLTRFARELVLISRSEPTIGLLFSLSFRGTVLIERRNFKLGF